MSALMGWGYLAVILGVFCEGETCLFLAMYAARQGALDPLAVFLCAGAAALASDLLFFWLGRRWGVRLLARPRRLARLAAALRRRVRRHAAPLVLSLRFLYGLRGALALACGAAKMPAGRFLLWDLISTLAWAGLYAAAAYWFGSLLSLQAHPLARWALPLLAAALLLAGNAWLSRRARLRLLARPRGDEGGRKGAALTV